MKQYGILMIGCGHIGLQHLADIYYRDNIQIIAVIDPQIDKAKEAAKKYNALHYGTDYRKYLNEANTHIVIIASYAATHLEILKDCLAAGKHVLCEKPIATTAEDGREFYDTVKASESKVLIAHILRHNRSYMKIRELLQSGEIGNIRVIRMVQNHHAMDWERYNRLLDDCSPIVDCGVHYIDIMQWFTGSPVIEVGGIGTRIEPDTEHPNYGLITAKLENGCIGFYEAGWSKNTASQNLKEFIGDKGRISLELKDHRSSNCEEGDLISIYHSDIGEYETINMQAEYKDMYAQISTLIEMIEKNVPANPTIDEVYSAFCTAISADIAIRENRIVRVK
ncbi:MAG: Gfo/Idh/MocA family oxidoreductase [Oscillospiraceae bacterium]|nr:Gfo/Idh/MocA family oxidoreductase [Oscillospiraceae bacterium]